MFLRAAVDWYYVFNFNEGGANRTRNILALFLFAPLIDALPTVKMATLGDYRFNRAFHTYFAVV